MGKRTDHGKRQDALRDAVHSSIDMACKEWDLNYYDCVGVLSIIIFDLNTQASEEEEE